MRKITFSNGMRITSIYQNESFTWPHFELIFHITQPIYRISSESTIFLSSSYRANNYIIQYFEFKSIIWKENGEKQKWPNFRFFSTKRVCILFIKNPLPNVNSFAKFELWNAGELVLAIPWVSWVSVYKYLVKFNK